MAEAVTVTFASPPFSAVDFNVDQPHNFIGLRGSSNTVQVGVSPLAVTFLTGTNYFSISASMIADGWVITASNGVAVWRSNVSSVALTNVLYTNAGPSDTYVVGQTEFLKTNSFSGGGSSGITALTGDGTASGSGSVTFTLVNIPNGTTMAGDILATAITAPSTPASGKGLIYLDSTSKNFSFKDDTGAVNHGIRTSATIAHEWISAIFDNGNTTLSQPTFTDISGTASASQIPVATTTSNGGVKVDGTSITISGGVISSTGGASGANPTATASDTAVNGSATTFLRSDGAPAVQKGSSSQFGVLKVDGTTITASGGVISSTGGSGITALTGDVTASGSGSVAATVKGINGTLLSSLQSGILFNTFGTGVPSTRNDWPSVASQLTLLIPQSALGTGSSGAGTKFLADDQTYKTVSSGGITSLASTNAFVPSVIGATGFVPTAFIHSNTFNAQSVDGTFTFGGFQGTNWSAATVGLGAGSATAAMADFDTNGTLDFVLPANLSASFKVYTNVSIKGYAGQFALAFTGAAAGNILGVCTADVNGDLRPDIIVVSGSAVEIFTNNGAAAQFVKEGSSYTVSGGVRAYSADFNGDGSADFIVSSSSGAATEWTNNLGTGVFVQDTASTFPAYAHATLPGAIAHFMGTTNWDIVLNNGTPVGVLLITNNGSGVFTISTTNKDFLIDGSMNTNDFNGDGMVDVVVDQSTSGKTYVVTNNGVGGFGDYSSNNVPGASGSTLPVSTGDFNMDGLPDIVQPGGSGTGGYVILTNAGAGLGFGVFTTNLIQVNPMEVWVGDFNGDGRADIGWYGFGSGSAQDSVNITYNLPVLYGILQGDGTNIVNGSITVTYSSSAVTPAGAWQPNLATFGNLNISTNYLHYSATAALFTLGTVMTANTTATVTFNTAGTSETVYNTSASTIGSLAITLSTSATPGMINRYATHGICSVVTVTGTVSIGAAVTAITADSSVAWQALTASTWARIQ